MVVMRGRVELESCEGWAVVARSKPRAAVDDRIYTLPDLSPFSLRDRHMLTWAVVITALPATEIAPTEVALDAAAMAWSIAPASSFWAAAETGGGGGGGGSTVEAD